MGTGESRCPRPSLRQSELKSIDPPPPGSSRTLFLHHFSWALLKDGMGLDHFWSTPAPSMTLSLSVSIPFTLLLLNGHFFLGSGKENGLRETTHLSFLGELILTLPSTSTPPEPVTTSGDTEPNPKSNTFHFLDVQSPFSLFCYIFSFEGMY